MDGLVSIFRCAIKLKFVKTVWGVATRTFYALGVSRYSVTPGDYVMAICFCCGASVASEQQHKQDLRRIYKREYDSRNHHFLPECIAPLYQNALRLLPECISPFYQNALRILPECIAPRTTREVVTPLCCRPFSRGLQLIKVRYGLLLLLLL